MFKIHEIREMIKIIDESTVECLEIEDGDSKIFLRRNLMINPAVIQENNTTKLAISPVSETPAHAAVITNKEISEAPLEAAATKEVIDKVHTRSENIGNENLLKIVSPMVGTFYKAPAADCAPFVKVGDKVEKSTVVCILEAMKLFNEIEAEIDGEIVEVLVENGQLVEYGQTLFLVKQTS
ncbi:acetyl-CoA carboxylase biotin carboxyl carrier protein [Neobacillus niacini]|uniref:acetyl-CoA carboxylase biotin carboxyl carrier protein n=1 Tax=Neobacillus niacini TaxID=86668 RepID=UPI003982FA30